MILSILMAALGGNEWTEIVRDADTALLKAMWRYRWLALGVVIVCTAAAAGLGITRPVSYAASASLVIEDPRSSSLFGSLGVVSPTRYLADQVAILQSGAVAVRAAELAAEQGFRKLDGTAFLEGAQIEASGESNFVLVTFEASEADAAVVGANALADAYRDVSRSESIKSAASALEQLDQKILVIESELLGLQTRIDDLRLIGPLGSNVDQQYQTVLDRLSDLYSNVGAGEYTDSQRIELTDLSEQLGTIQQIVGLEGDSSELAALLQEQAAAISQRADLRSRRDEIEIDAELQSRSVAFFSPALEGERTGTRLRFSLTIGAFLGVLAGAALAYVLANRRRVFTGRFEPEAVLHAPLLAEVPDFREERLKSALPVRDAPRSMAAEAFRFAVAGIEIQTVQDQGDPLPSQERVRSLAVVSGRVDDGKTTVATNLALAAARRGSRVLVIDADFGDQQLSNHLSTSPIMRSGITDIVERGQRLDASVETVELTPGVQIDLLSRGSVSISAPDFFRSAGAREFFLAVRDEYDLVLMDTPPILQAAYASLLTRYVDKVLVVVGHGSSQHLLEDVRDRLALLGTQVAGYIYNRAPLRKEVTGSEGSMKDVLGSS